MRRVAWLLWAAITVAAAAGAAVAVLSVAPDRQPSVAAVVAGVAAVVQASTAVVIVLLTHRLVGSARQSQEDADRQTHVASEALRVAGEQAEAARQAIAVSRDQLDLAERTDQLTRRDRQLLAVPHLRFAYETHSSFEDDLTLVLSLSNDSDALALGVKVAVRGKGHRRDQPSPHRAYASVDQVVPRTGGTVTFDMNGFRNITAGIVDHEKPAGVWTYPWFAVEVEYAGLLGQRVAQEYSWWAERPIGPGDPAWYFERLSIAPAVVGAEPLDLSF